MSMLSDINDGLGKLFPKTRHKGFELFFTGFIPTQDTTGVFAHMKVWGLPGGPYVNMVVGASVGPATAYSPGDVFDLSPGGLQPEYSQEFALKATKLVVEAWEKAKKIADHLDAIAEETVGGNKGLVKLGNETLTTLSRKAIAD